MDRIFRIKNNGAVDDKYFVLECGNMDRGRQQGKNARKYEV